MEKLQFEQFKEILTTQDANGKFLQSVFENLGDTVLTDGATLGEYKKTFESADPNSKDEIKKFFFKEENLKSIYSKYEEVFGEKESSQNGAAKVEEPEERRASENVVNAGLKQLLDDSGISSDKQIFVLKEIYGKDEGCPSTELYSSYKNNFECTEDGLKQIVHNLINRINQKLKKLNYEVRCENSVYSFGKLDSGTSLEDFGIKIVYDVSKINPDVKLSDLKELENHGLKLKNILPTIIESVLGVEIEVK